MGQKILIVDDDIALRQYTAQLLIGCGYTVSQLGDADNLVNEARREEVDLILLDFHLPGVDGLMALRQLRSKLLTLPVIVMTADTNPQVILQCFRAGADDFIGKPFDEVYLSVIVERTLDRASLSLKNSVFRLLKYARHIDECEQSPAKECICGLEETIWEATQATRREKDIK
ncbi:MAG: response regulator [Rhodospirillaceae bacterium]|jgi:CheY-like chemotaxis protein|nr:response regulator [Rhodospirillaceae bacterium]MBT5245211.1 response regulator [Rhodospirillaceae bacterium]MBT5561937.1 response regulator [Rhodospirillaceae bacterium]MBT6241945.1 response regulator [Rhodospirillaceae bacterium]MBT7138601.1 response regulator [Rhodospirillaceae bacterium]